MILQKFSGCMNFSTINDGVNVSCQEFSDELWEKFLKLFGHKPAEELVDSDERLSFVENTIELLGEYKCSDESCEQCGDYFEEWYLEFEE